MQYHGTLIAPVANRISGARATIAGQKFSFQANQDQRITLHSGDAGTYGKRWQITGHDVARVTLDITLPDGEGGFPGTRHIRAIYSLADAATLRLDITATTDAPTLSTAVNHSCWNLDGTWDWTGHSLPVAADRYLPTTADFAPTGQIATAAGTGHDITTARRSAPQQPPLDTCFCLVDGRGPLRDAPVLRDQTGIAMSVATTAPGAPPARALPSNRKPGPTRRTTRSSRRSC